jgi:hypothetical protein
MLTPKPHDPRKQTMGAEAILPSSPALIREFAERHHLKLTDLVRREKVGINSTSAAHILVSQGYAQLDDRALSDPSIGLLLNLLHRNFEHAEAAIAAFVTGCGSSAEVVARASVESSVNILHILAGERGSRLRAYFDHYLQEVDTQVRKWRAHLSELNQNNAGIHQAAIDRRLAANAKLRQVVDTYFDSAGERWPKINERFKCIGEGIGHRTFYARMSSEVHGDAEETLRYFIGRVHNDETLLNSMALETVWTTRLYVYYAVSFFLRASLAYARSYSLRRIEDELERELAAVERELVEISEHVGADL